MHCQINISFPLLLDLLFFTANMSFINYIPYLGTNLLPQVAQGKFCSSTISSRNALVSVPAEECWHLEQWKPELKCEPPPMSQSHVYSSSRKTSTALTQTVDLTKQGCSQKFFEECKPQIGIISW